MNKIKNKSLSLSYIKKLIREENKNIDHLNQIVLKSLEEEDSLVNQILQNQKDEKMTFGMRLADRVASFGGSWHFIILFGLIVCVWMIFNTILGAEAFDAYPYILLNLVLSCLAAFQAPVILMSQNRQSDKEHKRSEHEYIINLKAELQIRELNSKIDILMIEQMKVLIDIQEVQLSHLHNLEKKIDKLNNK